jgi:hypothetical protein
MFEGPVVAIVWLMTPAIIAFGSIGAALGVHAISNCWAEGDEDASKRAQQASFINQYRKSGHV